MNCWSACATVKFLIFYFNFCLRTWQKRLTMVKEREEAKRSWMTWGDVKERWSGENNCELFVVSWVSVGELNSIKCLLTSMRVEVNNLTAIIIRDVASENGTTFDYAWLVLWCVTLWGTDDHPVKDKWRALKSDSRYSRLKSAISILR